MTADIPFALHPSDRRTPVAEREKMLAEPGFGRVFTDHRVTIAGTKPDGWHDAQLRPYGPHTLDPACQVFHYGQEIFEGLKAYRQAGGFSANLPPSAHPALIARSPRRMGMPPLPE